MANRQRPRLPNIVLIMSHLSGTENRYGCWEKTGRSRYPTATVAGKRTSIHRYMYEFCFGSIPEGMLVMHSCDNNRCVNPHHLRVGTNTDNMADMVTKGRFVRTNAKLAPDQVRAIRKDLRREVDIAADYGVTQSCIAHIRTRRTWASLKD